MASRNRKIAIPMPLGGLNTIEPFNEDLSYARELTNYAIVNGRLKTRPSVRTEIDGDVSLAGLNVHWFDPATIGAGCEAILSNANIRTLSTGAGATSAGSSATYVNAYKIKHVSLELVIGCATPRLAASPFTATTITSADITMANVTSAVSHKGRLYLSDGTILVYSQVAHIAGAITAGNTFSVTEFMDGQTILRMFSVTAQPGVTTENLFVIFGSGGRVLVYQGEYPGSSTWALVAKYDMPAPISNTGFLEIDSDIFVSAQDYCYWFRDLFLQGAQSAYQNSPCRQIENIWQSAYFVGTTSLPEASYVWYDKNLDAIITQVAEKTTGEFDLGLIAEHNNEACWFVYFRKYKAWAVWFPTFFCQPVLEYQGAYYGTSSGYPDIVWLDSTRLTDQYAGTTEIPIYTSWKTPYFAGFDQGTQKLSGVRIFFDDVVDDSGE